MSERTVFLSAGEQSGDLHAAELAAELRRRIPGVRLYGLGGSRMEEAGVTLLADLDRLAVLGFAEVVRHLPDLSRLRRDVRRFLTDRGVDLLVAIDYPGFNLPLVRFARRQGISVLYYIAPQVWAWHESRARQLAMDTDRVCVVLPFEPDLLARYGANVEFVGHPLLDRHRPSHRPTTEAPEAAGGAEGEAAAEPESNEPPILGLFPGSRVQEVRRMLPVFLSASRRIRARIPELRTRVARARDLPAAVYDACGDEELVAAEEVLSEATAAITKSGTITLQLAIAGVPMVVGYRMNRLTYWIARHVVRIDHIALANLVAGERLVPEFVQHAATPAALADAVEPFLDPASSERERVTRGLAGVRRRLGEPGATRRVADACVRLLEERRWTRS